VAALSSADGRGTVQLRDRVRRSTGRIARFEVDGSLLQLGSSHKDTRAR
jgi:hypothetical protein